MVGLVQFVPPELSFWMDPKYPGYTQVLSWSSPIFSIAYDPDSV